MRNFFAKAFYFLLVAPLIPLAILCYLGEKLTEAKWPERWVDWAHKLAKKVTGV